MCKVCFTLVLSQASLNLTILSAHERFFLWPSSVVFGLSTLYLYQRHYFLLLYCSGFAKILELSGCYECAGGKGGVVGVCGGMVLAHVGGGVFVEGWVYQWTLFQRVLHSLCGQSYLQSQAWDMPGNKENKQVSSDSTNPHIYSKALSFQGVLGDFLAII